MLMKDMDGFLNLQEMNNLLELAQRPTMTMPEFSDFKMRHDSSAQGITRDGFVHYMKIRGEDILKEVIKFVSLCIPQRQAQIKSTYDRYVGFTHTFRYTSHKSNRLG
eukprot:m.78838 g.78838  ORF g.78838 m.78838 type:complete len:107 (+) comp12550_c0_seq1:3007-3327(+)